MKRFSFVAQLLVALVLSGLLPASAKTPGVGDLVRQPGFFAIAYQQSSAEYKALCQQTYNNAEDVIIERLLNAGYVKYEGRLCQRVLITTAEGKVVEQFRPLAIVLDLDETVLDNSGYEAWCLHKKVVYDARSWNEWCTFQGEVPAAQKGVPGAVEFLQTMHRVGISPIYITDRDESCRQGTLATLVGLGLGTEDLNERLILKDKIQTIAGDKAIVAKMGWEPSSEQGQSVLNNSSAKAGRRLQVDTKYEVLGWFGDNLYDFPVNVSKSLPKTQEYKNARDLEVINSADQWGSRYFILPNPMYGSWLYTSSLDDKTADTYLDDFGFGAWKAKLDKK